MRLTTFNSKLAVRCHSIKAANRLSAILNNDGYGTKIRLVKAKRNVHPRHFLILVFPPWR
jgi:hypothetical protein